MSPSCSRSLAVWAALTCAGCLDEPEGEGEGELRAGLEDGLELHWTFENHLGSQVIDLSGKDRHGSLQGGSFVDSPFGEAVRLDGVDDFIAFIGPRDPAIYAGIAGEFTIHTRVRVANVGKFNTLCFGCGPFAVMYVGTESYGARVLTALHDKGTKGFLWPWSSKTLANDTWVDLTLVVDGGVAARIYIDCVLDAELESPDIGLKDYHYSAVGRGAITSRWYEGEIDDLRVWSRALAEKEIVTICEPPPEL